MDRSIHPSKRDPDPIAKSLILAKKISYLSSATGLALRTTRERKLEIPYRQAKKSGYVAGGSLLRGGPLEKRRTRTARMSAREDPWWRPVACFASAWARNGSARVFRGRSRE